LILGKSIEDAIERADKYVEAGADGIMIHSKEKSGSDIKEFCELFRKINKNIPIVVVPSTFNHITEDEFHNWGINIVIYANHMLRSSYPAMVDVAKSILLNGRSFDANDKCMAINEILELIPGTK
jgi:phosphoenolpyruvate phosphomutase